jgi:cellulose synthase/poly-beta-1,6-N-acetylglucosamine synthase-like glycosyltransferase
VRLGHNLGPAGARQAALPHVRTRFVAFVDSDVTVDDAVLDRLCWWLEEDPSLGAVAPRIVGVRALDLGPDSGLVRPLSPIAYVPSACLVMRTEVWRLHGFDPALRFGEDVDLCWRLLDAGFTVRLDAQVQARHDVVRDVLRRRHLYGTSAAPLEERHPGSVAPFVVAPVPLAAIAVRSPLVVGFMLGRLAHQLHRAGAPPRAAVRLTAESLVATAAGLATFTSTVAWPLAVWTSPLLPLPHLRSWWRRRPPQDLVTWTVSGLAQDVAYGTDQPSPTRGGAPPAGAELCRSIIGDRGRLRCPERPDPSVRSISGA